MSALTSTLSIGRVVGVSNTFTFATLHGLGESHGIWYGITERLFNRGLIDDILNTPGNIISQVLSSPATTTQNHDQAVNTQVAATTQAAAAPAATTQAAAAPAATTHAPAAQQPAATPASSPKQEEQQQTPSPAAQAPATTQQPAQQPMSTNAAATTVAAPGSSPAAVLTTSAPAAAETVPPAAENAASSLVLSQTSNSIPTGAVNSGGAATTKPGATSSTQTPQSPDSGSKSTSSNQGPLVATGAVLGIVVLLGLSLLIFWCYRRKKRAALHGHEVVPPESPINDYGSNDRFRDHADQTFHGMAQNRTANIPDELIIQHPQPGQPAPTQTHPHAQGDGSPRVNPYAAQPFSYAQAQQYVQSLADTGTFGFPPPPPIPEPSPIRIFRWPTRSSRTGSSAPSVFSGFRSNKTSSRHQSRASRSTMSSMLWHGRRDIIARSTMNHIPVSPRSNFYSTHSPESTMPEGLHTPILDWLNWIRGHQQVEPDPEMNHRKSFASTTESSASDGSGTSSASTASSGVFSPTLMSWHPPANTPCVTPETFQYIPLPLFRSPSSNDEKLPQTSGGVRVPKFG
ncbi:hypothetical protein CT0861_11397 [Colletotrichum tofieldiae]|uniref:Uncharacterized protein n=1 Tax=Colletotrichum tofieldiae TaxID=708197 RepID=A0A166W544_9PEZI|nr:hypothetical protein CT0861_11397 [Colletotrichum tofieldiae]